MIHVSFGILCRHLLCLGWFGAHTGHLVSLSFNTHADHDAHNGHSMPIFSAHGMGFSAYTQHSVPKVGAHSAVDCHFGHWAYIWYHVLGAQGTFDTQTGNWVHIVTTRYFNSHIWCPWCLSALTVPKKILRVFKFSRGWFNWIKQTTILKEVKLLQLSLHLYKLYTCLFLS